MNDSQSQGFEYDPFSAAMIADPYPAYRILRDDHPIYWSDRRQMWVVSRYEDVIHVTKEWKVFSSARGADSDDLGGLFPDPGNFLDEDPPPHDVLRKVLHASFTPKALSQELADPIRRRVEEIVERIRAHDTADLAHEIGWPVPVFAVSTLLGIPEQDHNRIWELGEAVTRRIPGRMEPPDAAQVALQDIRDYVAQNLERYRAKPRDGLLSHIATAELDGKPLGDAGVGMATLLVVAGLETTASLITNSLYLLARYPDQRKWLRENTESIPAAVEEILRFESPVQHLRRTTTTATELHGTSVPAGSTVLVLFGSANRDERYFREPDVFDVRRESKRNLAFGSGIHHCLGAPLARLEARIVLETVLRAMPKYELAGTPTRFPSHMDRGFEHLPARPSLAMAETG